MKVSEYSPEEFIRQVRRDSVLLHIGPFSVRVRSPLEDVAAGIHLHYEDYFVSDQEFADFHVTVEPPRGFRKWFHPQVNFIFDGYTPFKPLPRDQAFAMFEWGLNWCISSFAQDYFLLHAAVVEKNGFAAVLPAPPGAGKSTLCAGLVSRGWRLLSDELTLIPVNEPRQVIPVPRPISLKNASIDVMRDFAPGAVIGPIVRDTTKGTVAHMRAPAESVLRGCETARLKWIVFPQYKPASPTILAPRAKTRSFMEIATQSFNFSILGETGFGILKQVISDCDCCDFIYSDLDEAIATFDSLADGQQDICAA